MTTVYVTAPPEAAADLARAVVEERLAACVNRFECSSVYRWEGAVTADEEVALLAKTTADSADALVERIEALHPYEVPCIEQFEASDVHPPFAAWCADATDG